MSIRVDTQHKDMTRHAHLISRLLLVRAHHGWGCSSFGKVFKAQHQETAHLAAVKIVPVEQDTGEVAREIDTLKKCQSPNIVHYYGSATKDGELWIIMEFCAGSSLSDIMEARGRCLNEAQIAAAMAGTLMGLAYLHERPCKAVKATSRNPRTPRGPRKAQEFRKS